MITAQAQQFPTFNSLSSPISHSLYIHIPFCRRRCYYCDFPVSVVGDNVTKTKGDFATTYVEKLCREIEITPKLSSHKLETIFFGGGTPSLLPLPALSKILTTVEANFGIAKNAEISLEIDPGTFDLAKITAYRQLGVNRLSLGVQAFQDNLLSSCGRSHSSNDIFTAVELVRQGGISNLSLDLISGLPHQTLDDWQVSLEMAIELAPNHLSCYDLVLEPVTAFGKQYEPGAKPLPSDTTTAQMYRLAQSLLTDAGYEHYEISNYAQPGYQCQHNLTYWQNRPYYGVGMGAASYTQGKRFTRPRTRREYYVWVQQLQEAEGVIDCPLTSKEDHLLETLMLGLRLVEGIDLAEFRQEFGEESLGKIWACLQRYEAENWVQVRQGNRERMIMTPKSPLPSQGRLGLSDPEGLLFSNTILADLFSSL